MSLGGVESPRSLTLRTQDVSGSISNRPLDVSGIEQSGLHLSTFFDSLKGPSAFTRVSGVSESPEYPSISGPLPPVLLNRFDKLSQSLYPDFAESQSIRCSQYPLELPPSPKESPNSLCVSEESHNSLCVSEVSGVQVSVSTQETETQVSVETQVSEVQVSVETQVSEFQASVNVKDAVIQTLVGENRLEVPRLR